MAQQRAIGNSNARSISDESGLSAVHEADPQRPPTRRPRSLSRSERSERGIAFGLGLLIGLVPLIAVVGGLVGYFLAGRNDNPQTLDASASSAPSGPAAGSSSGSASFLETSVPTVTTVAPTPPAVDPSPVAAVVRDGKVFIEGTLPAAAADGYVREFTALADALGYELVGDPTVDGNAAVPTEIPVRFADAVFFGPDRDDLDSAFLPLLMAVADYLQSGSSSLTIIAHTDASGSEATNLHLAQHRAGAVFQYLVDRGVDGARLRVDPRGEIEASGALGSAAESERRVEFVLGVEL